MTYRFAASFVCMLLLASPVAPVLAQENTLGPDDLYAAMRLDEIVAVMRDEGLAYGDDIAADLFGGAAPPEWGKLIAAIYDEDRMKAEVQTALSEALDGVDVEPMVAFFETEPGRTFIALEISARQAMLDEAVEEAAKEAAAVAMADETPRFQLVTRYVDANDLIDTNVVSAMNSNVAYYMGLLQGGAMAGDVTEDQIISDVWGQEPEIRANTTEWVYTFLLMAYDPVPDADIEAYVAFSETPAGQALNRAVFQAFDGMFSDISNALGQASAQFLVTQEL